MTLETLRSRARVLMWLVTVPFALLGLGLIVEIYVLATYSRGREELIILHFPLYLYFGAIWMARQALKAIASGAMFDSVVPRLLLRIGVVLFVGALFNVFGHPLLMWALQGTPAFVAWDGAAVALGVIGATLVLVSRLVAEAAEMRRELDEMF